MASGQGPPSFWAGLFILLFLIAGLVARSRRTEVPVWSIMAFASLIAVVSGLTPIEAVALVIDVDVILFLIGMFSIVAVAESSGLLGFIAYSVAHRFKRTYTALVALSLILGLLSAIAMNDTMALAGPPIVYSFSRAIGIDPKPAFILLAFSITIGSVATPIGNPQNLLIAVGSKMPSPFIDFVKHLLLPTLVNLVATALIVAKVYGISNRRIEGHGRGGEHSISNPRDAAIAALALASVIAILVVNDLLALMGLPHVEHRGFIPFVLAAGLYIMVSSPRETLRRVDWGTVVFFMTMFVTMHGVWRSGVLDPLLSAFMPSRDEGVANYLRIAASSLVLSQLLSNVPFAKLFLDYMKDLGYTPWDTGSWLTLAMASTIAGNLTVLGAASNIIIIEVLESKFNSTITFSEFLKVGSLVTAVNLACYTVFMHVPSPW
ncbi:MAG: SLC13 family permease [Candidatus Nezhaarchaeota archaeon]|nr:SLC13 family permease [Candidatus Nezhaarchaeota archaeon]